MSRGIRPRSHSVDHDDSTDDEKVTAAVADYDILQAAEKFVEIGVIKSGAYGNPEDLKFAFALHAFGRAIYFSEPVNMIYGAKEGLKEKHLKSSAEAATRKTVAHTKFPIEGENFGSELSYIAHRRLNDRSLKRHSKNKHGDEKATAVSQDTVSTFFDGAESKESKKFTPNNKPSKYGQMYHGTRGDWIGLNQAAEEIPYLPNGRATTTVIGIIDSLTADGMSDQDIATNIRLTLKGNEVGSSPEEKKKLAFLANLMFGAEASRNPACYASSQMFLDLIENSHVGYQTWSAAFAGTRFPMMIKDAVAASRRINDLLNGEEVMPHDYHYDYNVSHDITRKFGGATESPSQKAYKNAKTILQQEARLAKDWLELNEIEESFEGIVAALPAKITDWYSDVDLNHFSNLIIEEATEAVVTNPQANLAADFAADAKEEHESPKTSVRPEAKKIKKLSERSGGRGIGGDSDSDGDKDS
ncbi:MAG: hypothetical protein KA100_00425 [Rickettsiales bacterium]|nr:hypothetical protein [Rickettsiales bacterium]